MNLPLRELPPDLGPAPDTSPPPQVFVRALTTPPGAPWEQARAARLDARHGSPLPIGELLHQVRRLDRWRPGQSGRFAAFYVRAREARDPFETTVDVEGQAVTVRFGTSAPDLRRLRGVGLGLAALVVSGAALGTGVMLALGAKSSVQAELEANEQLAASRLPAAAAYKARVRQARELKALAGAARPLDEVLADLSWVATSKTPEARIVGVHWERGLLAIEARGEQPPFLAVDRAIERSERPLRPGVWLWAVGRPGSGAATPAPVAAEFGP